MNVTLSHRGLLLYAGLCGFPIVLYLHVAPCVVALRYSFDILKNYKTHPPHAAHARAATPESAGRVARPVALEEGDSWGDSCVTTKALTRTGDPLGDRALVYKIEKGYASDPVLSMSCSSINDRDRRIKARTTDDTSTVVRCPAAAGFVGGAHGAPRRVVIT